MNLCTVSHGREEWGVRRPTTLRLHQLRIPARRFRELNHQRLRFELSGYRAEFLYFGFFEPRWWRNFMHAHTHFEVCYAFAGQGVFRIHGQDQTVKAGDVFVARPMEDHEIVSSRRDPLGIYFWSYTLVPPAVSSGAAENSVANLLRAFAESRTCISARVPGMLRTLELLTEEAVRAEPGQAEVLEGLARKLILDTARATGGSPFPGASVRPAANPGSATVRQALRYLHDNLGRPFAIGDVAAQVCLSERHLNRLFRAHLQQSPLDYLTTVRMETAAQLLLDRALPIKQIAERVGFPDVRYFGTLFRKRTGQTPAAFRARGGTLFRTRRKRTVFAPQHA